MTSSSTATADGLRQQSRRRSAASALAGTGTRTVALLRRVRDAVGHAARAVRWYVRQLMGDDAYRVYVEHERSVHPDREPMAERAFWRARTDDQERNPGARCC